MNENFLNQRFNLTKKTAAEKSHGDNAREKVANYLNRIEEISKNERGLKHLKERYINHSLADISGDKLEKYKKEILNKREYQKESLERILDYVIQNEDNHPNWFRYFILRSIQKMGELKPDEKKFTNRTKTTLAPFLDLNHEAVGFVRKMLEKQFKLENIQLDREEIEKLKDKNERKKALREKKEKKQEYIISELNLDENLNQELLKKLEKKSFDELYAFAITEVTKNIEHLTTEGKWKKFEQNSEPKILEESLENKGTGWCTASGSAPEHLEEGDFYVYYTYTPEEWEKKEKGEKVEPSQPGIAIRMLNGEVYEVRGTEPNQNLSPELVEIASEKYITLPGGDEFEKKRDDMNKLTEIYSRFEKDKEGKLISTEVKLSDEEISFLYELKDEIEGFGYQKDPRIKEILDLRNKKKDLEKVYGEGVVAFKLEEINENTRFYEGDLSEEHLDILRNKIKNPFYLKGNLNLSSLTTAKGLTLPEKLGGNLYLSSLTTAEGLSLPENIGWSLNLNSLTTAKGLTLPEKLGGNLYLSSLTTTEGLTLPENIGGSLYLNSLTTAEGITFPKNIGGDLDLDNLTTAKDLIFPKNVGGYLDLRNLITAEGLTLPKNIGGSLLLNRLTTAKDLIFPKNVGRSLSLNNLTTAEGLTPPKKVGESLFLNNLTIAEGLSLPENVGKKIYLESLSLVELNKLAERYPQYKDKILAEHNTDGEDKKKII